MSELYGSKRTVERATFTPIKRRRRSPERPEDDHGSAWQKWSYFAALSPSAAELSQIAARLPNATDSDRAQLRRLSELAEGTSALPRVSLAVDSVRHFTDVSPDLLQRMGEALVSVRAGVRDDALAAQKELLTLQARQPTPGPGDAGSGETPAVPPGFELDPTFVDPAMPGYRMYRQRDVPLTLTPLAPAREDDAAGDRPDPLRALETSDTPARTFRGTTSVGGFFLAPPPPEPVRAAPIRAARRRSTTSSR